MPKGTTVNVPKLSRPSRAFLASGFIDEILSEQTPRKNEIRNSRGSVAGSVYSSATKPNNMKQSTKKLDFDNRSSSSRGSINMVNRDSPRKSMSRLNTHGDVSPRKDQ